MRVASRVGSQRATLAANHRGRGWEPFEGSHNNGVGSQRTTLAANHRGRAWEPFEGSHNNGVGSQRATLAANHRGRGWEPFEGSHNNGVGSQRATLAANHRGRGWEPSEGSHHSHLGSHSRPVMLLSLALVGLAGCAGADLAAGVREVRQQLATARSQGAYVCAPRELASGEANAEFAEREFDKGEYFVAKDRLGVAQASAKEALRLSSDERSCPKPKPQPPRRKEPAPDPTADRDGDGIPDVRDKCPNQPEDKDGFQDDDGCPDPDNDEDGILDSADKCPNEPEDFDGFEDEDGCPDLDNDQDGVPDASDKCPNQPGPASNDGCPPKFEHINVTQEKIELEQAIFFQTAKAIIMSKSYGLLDEVAAALAARPTMQVRIEGHTDSRGGHAYNLRLSQARADSVKAYLVGKGISSDRMEAKGYGPDRPIDTNKTAAGRERNRRVEFTITQQ